MSLDFTQTGRVSQILVSTGQTVTKGQPLATLDQSYAQATLQDAVAVLAADQTVVKALQSPTLSSAGRQNLALQVAAADQQLSSAQQASQDAVAQAGAQVAQAQQTVQNAQATSRRTPPSTRRTATRRPMPPTSRPSRCRRRCRRRC
ncbi:biotin/lipoyl-binding protein [Streptacidiphilus sp. 4-A2]|nr:biotin/lipoyl-binding protein [Streptacidiphilus sp. 4-A2]